MQIRNNYKLEWKIFSDGTKGGLLDQGIGVFNGDMGIVTEINDFDEKVIVTFDDGRVASYDYNMLDELEHAFAITIHKSQGSEYPVVVIPLLMTHFVMLQRNLVYTGITRAKKICIIVGTTKALAYSVHNMVVLKRNTKLKERLTT